MSELPPIPGLSGPDPKVSTDSDQNSLEEASEHQQGAAAELRGKVQSAVAIVAGRNLIIKVVALLGNVVFARLLSPADFGAVAFGLTVLGFAWLLSDGGLGVGLIRRPQAPHREDLRVLLGFQFLLTTTLAVAVAAAALPFGRTGLVTAVMMPALPLLAFRAPSSIVFERSLTYAPILRAEVVEEVAYYAWGIVTVLLGYGIWGLATASVVKALVGTVVLLSASPVARLAPSRSWLRLRPMLGFGIKFQAVELIGAGRGQLLNLGVAGVGGLSILGLWAMATRFLQIPFLLFSTLWRVSYPAAAQLLSVGESASKMIERGLRLAAVGTGAILAPATGSISPLIPALFGHRWAPVASVLPPIFFAFQASGPISVSTVGYLYAVGDTTTVLYSATVVGVVWLAVSLPLISPLGVVALGLGGMMASLAEAVVLSRATRRRTGAMIWKPILMPWISASFAAAVGWFVSRTLSHGLIAALLGATTAMCLYVIPIAFLRREEGLTILRVALHAVRPTGATSTQST